MICKRCGKPIKSKSLKCGSCGEKHKLWECSGFSYAQKRTFFSTVHKTDIPTAGEDIPAFSRKTIALIAGAAAVIMAAVASFGFTFLRQKEQNIIPDFEEITSNEPVGDYLDTSVKFATLGEANREVETPEDALEVLENVSGIYGYDDADTQLRYTGDTVLSEIAKHYVFDQVCDGRRVYGKSMIVTVSRETKKVIVISGNYEPINERFKDVGITAETAGEKAQKEIGGTVKSKPENVVLCTHKPQNTWLVKIENKDGLKNIFVDAQNGNIIFVKESNIVADPDIEIARNALAETEGEEQSEFVKAERARMIIIRNRTAEIPFNSTIISNSLFEMYGRLSDNQELVGKITDVWRNAMYLLPEEADFTDCITAADILAGNGMLNAKERKEMLTLLESYDKIPEKTVEIMGADNEFIVYGNDNKAFLDYTYEVQLCDEDMNPGDVCHYGSGTDEEQFDFECGRIYCVTITEKGNNNPDDERREFIYCTDIDADYKLYTNFETNSEELI